MIHKYIRLKPRILEKQNKFPLPFSDTAKRKLEEGEKLKAAEATTMDCSTNESKENVAENTDKKPKRKSKKKKKKKDVPKEEISTEKVLQRASDILEMLKD